MVIEVQFISPLFVTVSGTPVVVVLRAGRHADLVGGLHSLRQGAGLVSC